MVQIVHSAPGQVEAWLALPLCLHRNSKWLNMASVDLFSWNKVMERKIVYLAMVYIQAFIYGVELSIPKEVSTPPNYKFESVWVRFLMKLDRAGSHCPVGFCLLPFPLQN